ncbi:cytochrome P450 [Catenulispora sp. GP43]|uniref:cytochrome P450 n=1 Tax=Catenulispora sp. GP43 TaxID=3156263 RepID=UPI0035114149
MPSTDAADSTHIDDFPFSAGLFGGPSPAFDELRAACPVSRLRAPSGAVVNVATTYQDAEFVHRALSRRATLDVGVEFVAGDNHNGEYSISAMDPPQHTRLRGLISPALAPRKVAAWEPLVRRIAEDVVAGMRAGDLAGDLADVFCLELPVRVVCELLGVARADIPQFRRWTNAVIANTGMPVDERLALITEFREHLGALVAGRLADPGAGLVGDLIRARADDGDRLAEQELVSMVFALIIGGYETTSTVLARGTLTLLRHPEVLAELRADPVLWADAVEEILRYDSTSTGGLLRVAVEDTVLPSGTTVEAGQACIGQISAANFDPARFPEPHTFDIHRPDRRHMSFGQGPHFCAGAPLARLELRIGLSTLFGAFPELRLTVPAEELQWTVGTRVRALTALPVAWGPREA